MYVYVGGPLNQELTTQWTQGYPVNLMQVFASSHYGAAMGINIPPEQHVHIHKYKTQTHQHNRAGARMYGISSHTGVCVSLDVITIASRCFCAFMCYVLSIMIAIMKNCLVHFLFISIISKI